MYRFQRGDIAGAQTDFLALRDLRARAKLPADTSVSMYLSAIERASGFPAKAKPWAEESVALADAANGATSIDALQAREELAVVERDLRDWAAARKDAQFALDNFIVSGGPQQMKNGPACVFCWHRSITRNRIAIARSRFSRKPRNASAHVPIWTACIRQVPRNCSTDCQSRRCTISRRRRLRS